MSARRVLDLGHCGKIPIDSLFELHLETRDGQMITLYQSRMARSLGTWVYDGASALARYIEAYVIGEMDESKGQDKDKGQDEGEDQDKGKGKGKGQDKDKGKGKGKDNDKGQDKDKGRDEDKGKDEGKDEGQDQDKDKGQDKGKGQDNDKDKDKGKDGSTAAASSERPLSGKSVVELGAGTGIVGILMAYYGAEVVSTDLETLVPLIRHNIERNADVLGGRARAAPLRWGDEPGPDLPREADYVVLANCVYYEGVLEALASTTRRLAGRRTVVYACYEERIPEIRRLVDRWHRIVGQYFAVEEIPIEYYRRMAELDCIRIVRMTLK